MRAILLAAGYGSRLRPLTDHTPKCLVPIKGKKLLEIWLQHLTAAGIESFLINTHYLSEQVKEFIEESPYRDRVVLVHEPQLLGTVGTLLENLSFFQGEDGLLIHADNYCFPDIQEFIRVHQERAAKYLMTMMTFRTNTPSSCGIVELDKNGAMSGFYEKVPFPPGNLANAAIYLFSKNFYRILETKFGHAKDFSTEILPELIGQVSTYETPVKFLDIGTLEAYQQANKELFDNL